ncbi:Storkhead-box protein 2 [Camelus dromedarius]|uniref:Storkhead-box protein 2 n=1 Tax=Camelus dromedarius TaxID=9838 RepID=A0A5N4CET0_CAMDR|nr:Storkhead-box protein 2 [Camelus dromedarius]
MKKTRSTTLRRAWPSSDFSDRASDRMRSRSEKDYRLHKRFPAAFAPQASRGYMTSGSMNSSGWFESGKRSAYVSSWSDLHAENCVDAD